MIIYLEMNETNLPEGSTVGISIRVPVESPEAAPALRDELAARFFVGVPHEDCLHLHSADSPCEVVPLP